MYFFPVHVCYVTVHVKAFIPKSLSYQHFHADESLYAFALTASGLGLISPMRLNGRKNIQSVKSPQSVLHGEFEACVLPPPEVTIKDLKRKNIFGSNWRRNIGQHVFKV